MSKKNLMCSFLCVQILALVHKLVLALSVLQFMHAHDPFYVCASLIHVYTGLFLHMCICSSVYACTRSSLRMHAEFCVRKVFPAYA